MQIREHIRGRHMAQEVHEERARSTAPCRIDFDGPSMTCRRVRRPSSGICQQRPSTAGLTGSLGAQEPRPNSVVTTVAGSAPAQPLLGNSWKHSTIQLAIPTLRDSRPDNRSRYEPHLTNFAFGAIIFTELNT